jgi:putative ABC transport system permease protein
MLGNYLKVAWKVLARRKFFTFTSLFGISLTLAVLLVATALLDGVFAPRRPESRLPRTLGVFQLQLAGPHSTRTGTPGYLFLDRSLRGLPGAEAVSIASEAQTVVSFLDGRKVVSYLKRTDGAFWRILDFEFLEGGPFTDEDEANANFVAVVNASTRDRFFGGAPALGKTIELDGQRFRVVGVVPDVPIVRLVPFADVWVPLATAKSADYRTQFMGDMTGLVLARRRADLPRLKAEFQDAIRRAEIPDPQRFETLTGHADTLFEYAARFFLSNDLRGDKAGRLRALLATLAVLFMVLPAVNLVNLNLSRILERASEIGVRKAFGAGAGTLVGQFVVENLVLTLVGGLLGLALAGLALAALNGSGLIPYAQFEVNHRVFGGGLLFATFFALLSGVYPAWRMARLHPVEALHGRTR